MSRLLTATRPEPRRASHPLGSLDLLLVVAVVLTAWLRTPVGELGSRAASSGVRHVKYCAPWSNACGGVRRVAVRPPTPRDFSNPTTSAPPRASSLATVEPAMPEDVKLDTDAPPQVVRVVASAMPRRIAD